MQTFIARQPIFDRRQKVYAYELLYRNSLVNQFDSREDVDQASLKMIADVCLVLNIENISDGQKAFVNVTQDVLLKGHVGLLPKGLTVVEIVETVKPIPEVIAACRRLKQAGYQIALDDFVYAERDNPLVDLADIIKIDFLGTNESERRALAEQFARQGISLLAEKVETQAAYDEAFELGCALFQGYFFSKPAVLSARDMPAYKLHYFRILQEINQPELDFTQIEEIIKRDISLAYKLLRYINSAAFGWRSEIGSIRQALVMLGDKKVKKWASLIAIASMGKDKPEELLVHATVRAKFCESLAPGTGLGDRAEDLFLMGMFSSLDAILDRSLADVLNEMPLADDIKRALLLSEENRLRDVYQYALAYERGDWTSPLAPTSELDLGDAEPPRLYLDAVKWVHQSFPKEALAD